MATLQDALVKAKNRVKQQIEKKEKAIEELKNFKELESEIMEDISLPAELRAELVKYRDDQSATELWDMDEEAKKLDKGDFLKWKKGLVIPEVELTAEQIPTVKLVYKALVKRKEKLTDNFDISITRAKKEQLLIELMIDTADKAIKTEFHAEYEKELCKDPEEKKKEKKDKYPDLPEPTETLDELVKVCTEYAASKGEAGQEWKFIGLVLSKHQLTPGAGGKLVKKSA